MSTTVDDARRVLRRVLGRIAPEVDLDTIDADAQLLEAGDLDSIDFLGLVSALEEEAGIAVPERDYPCLATAAGFVDYVSTATVGVTAARTPPSR